MPRIRKLTAIEAAIAQGYLAGGSLDNLASIHNVSPGTIRNILKRQKVALRKQGRRPN